MPKRHEIARPRSAQRRTRDKALHVVHRLERVLRLGPFGAAVRELLDRVEPVLNALQRDERPQEPAPQEAAAHGGHAAVDLVQQRALAAAGRRLDDLEVPQCRRIDNEVVRAGTEGHLTDVGEIDFLRVAQVMHQRAGGARGGRLVLQAEAEEALRLQLREQRSACRLDLERPGVDRGDERTEAQRLEHGARLGGALGDHHLAGTEYGKLVLQRLPAFFPVILRRGELPGGQIQQRHSESGPWRRRHDRHQERRLARIQIARVRQRPGRDHPHDLPPDQPFGLLRILHLLADGHAETLRDQPRDVGVCGVIGKATHGNGAPAGVLGAGGQRQLEGARRHERVLVEHLVEIPHPEEDNRVAILPLRLEELPHRGGGGGGVRRRGRGNGGSHV